jgi:hypothetical protein
LKEPANKQVEAADLQSVRHQLTPPTNENNILLPTDQLVIAMMHAFLLMMQCMYQFFK